MKIAPELLKIATTIADLIARGLDQEEIALRLADPHTVGGRMLARAVERRRLGVAYVTGKRDPDAVLVTVGEDDA